MTRRWLLTAALGIALSATAGCDRNLEPFDPREEPEQPDLSAIFPAGAERAAQASPALPPSPAPRGGRAARPVASSGEPIEGTIELASELADRVPSGAVLFVIARHGRSGPPLAAQRIPSPRFPLEFRIGPRDRMGGGLPFAGPIHLTVRVDADGDASTRDPGDLQGSAGESFRPGARGVSVLIDEVL